VACENAGQPAQDGVTLLAQGGEIAANAAELICPVGAAKAARNLALDLQHAQVALSTGETYTYDNNGNMRQRIEGGVAYTQTFDVENRLSTVQTITGTTAFVYDGDGQRVIFSKF
jgi:hypothetical protein